MRNEKKRNDVESRNHTYNFGMRNSRHFRGRERNVHIVHFLPLAFFFAGVPTCPTITSPDILLREEKGLLLLASLQLLASALS